MKPFLVNRDVVMASLRCDMGPYKLNNWCESMNLSSINPSTFSKYSKEFYSLNNKAADLLFIKAGELVKEMQRELFPMLEREGLPDVPIQEGTPADPIQIPVSFDGTWNRRGFSSLVGIGCVIDHLTGLVIDAHVMSKHCQTCAITGEALRTSKMPGAQRRYEAWKLNHDPDCDINFDREFI